jgi:tetratricopeptide (TPR) repeat protein
MRGETTWRLQSLGRWDEVVQTADAVLEFDFGGGQMGVIASLEKARVAVNRGELDAAGEVIDGILDRARGIGDPQVYWRALDTAALLAWQRGKLDESRSLFEEMARASQDKPGGRSFMALTAARVLVAAGALEEAEGFVASARPLHRTAELSLLAAGACLAEARGELDEARKGYEQAVAGWSAYGNPFETAMAQLGTGRCLVALGRAADAAGPLREARRTFGSLGARPFLSEADSLLEQATALTS